MRTDPALEAAVRETYAAWNAGDPEPLIRTLHPDVVWHTHSDVAESQTYHGIDGVRQFFAGWEEAWDEITAEVEGVERAPDGRLVILLRWRARGRASRIELDEKVAHVARFGDDGRVVEFHGYMSREEAAKLIGS